MRVARSMVLLCIWATVSCSSGPSGVLSSRTRCSQASDPVAFCAERFGVARDAIRCVADSCVRQRVDTGEGCADDIDCAAGLVCEGAACVAECSADSDCDRATERCLRRDGGLGRLCQARELLTVCTDAVDPLAYCAGELAATPDQVVCEDDACQLTDAPPMTPGMAGEPCLPPMDDAGCAGDLVCEGLCVATCAGPQDCVAETQDCAARPSGGAGEICLPKAPPETCDEAPDPLVFCASELNAPRDDVVCEMMQCALAPEPPWTVVRLRDASSGDACIEPANLDDRAPGADLIAMVLLDDAGAVVGHASQLRFVAGDAPEGNSFTQADAVIDGTRPDVDAEGCPNAQAGARRRSDSVVSLGCGGELVARFVDEQGDEVVLAAGQVIRVLAYAPVCDDPMGDPIGAARWSLDLCRDAQAAGGGDSSSCDVALAADRGGQAEVAVALP